MATEIQICNMALGHIGDTGRLTSLATPYQSVQAEHCANFLPTARDALFEMHTWGFTTRRGALVASSETPPSSWQYAYEAPIGVAPTLTNGEFTLDLSGWSLSHGGSGSDPVYASGQAFAVMIGGPSAGTNYSLLSQRVTGLLVGSVYTITYAITRSIGSGACDFKVMVGSAVGGSEIANHTAAGTGGVPASGTNTFTFTAQASSHYITAGLFDSTTSPANTQAFQLDYVRIAAGAVPIANYIAVLEPDAVDDISIAAGADYTPHPYVVESSAATGLPLIYTNVADAVLRYTTIVTDPSQFSPTFTIVLSWMLASQLAGPIIKGEQGVQMSLKCLQMVKYFMEQAMESDANQRRVRRDYAPPWIGGR